MCTKELLQIDKTQKLSKKVTKEYKQTNNRSVIQMAKLYEKMLKFMSTQRNEKGINNGHFTYNKVVKINKE